jgi:hypothetical protein
MSFKKKQQLVIRMRVISVGSDLRLPMSPSLAQKRT